MTTNIICNHCGKELDYKRIKDKKVYCNHCGREVAKSQLPKPQRFATVGVK